MWRNTFESDFPSLHTVASSKETWVVEVWDPSWKVGRDGILTSQGLLMIGSGNW